MEIILQDNKIIIVKTFLWNTQTFCFEGVILY